MSPFASLHALPRGSALADALLPRWLLESADAPALGRARGFVAVGLGASAFAVASALFHAGTGQPERSLFIVACTPLTWLALAVPHLTARSAIRRTAAGGRAAAPPSLRPALAMLLGVLLFTTSLAPLFSQAPYQVSISITIVPLLAAALGGWRTGALWTGLALEDLAAMSVATSGDPVRGLVAWNAIVVAATVGVGGCLVEAAWARARREADLANREADGLARARDEKEAELRAGRELLAHAFRRMPALLVLSDMTTGLITEVNEHFERLTGWSADEARGRTLSDLGVWVSPEDRTRILGLILDRGATRDIEIALRTKSGDEIWLLAAADLFELNGRAHVLAQGVDVTDRRRAEQALAASRKRLEERVVEESDKRRASQRELRAQRQLASIGTLAAGIAHQINNPIASIMASAEYALVAAPECGNGGAAIRDEALKSVVSEAARCGKIVKNVLRFARQQPTARWVEDVGPLARQTAMLCRSYVIEHGGELVVETGDESLPALVSPIEIEQVLVNLIRNAAESLDGEGTVAVRAARHEDRLEIAVDDTGRGMAPDVLEHLFAPFFTTRVHHGGTGLGLSFAHGVVVDHGGEIRVESEPGKGTRIRILLPLASG